MLQEAKTQTPNRPEVVRQETQQAGLKKITPRVDLYRTPRGAILEAELPGVKEDNLSVTVERDVLTIVGERTAEMPEGLQPLHLEYEPVSYERSFALADDVDREGIEARLRNGVLRLDLPRAQTHEPKKIPVKNA